LRTCLLIQRKGFRERERKEGRKKERTIERNKIEGEKDRKRRREGN